MVNGELKFYSDGLTETMNEQLAQFGEDALYAEVKSKKNLSAPDLQRSIINAAEKFRGQAEQHDDLTLVVVKSKPIN